MKNKKVILDTNLWISFLISRKLSEIDNLIDSQKITLLFSTESMEEFLTVAKRTKFAKYFSDNDLLELITKFDSFGKLILVKSQINACRDLKDNVLLNLAVDGKADFLVTGDLDLLVLEKLSNTTICTWNDFHLHIKSKTHK